MKNIIKIALLGSFPQFPYRHKINFRSQRPNLVTSWNVNLAYALAQNPLLEVHFFTNAALWRTKTLRDKNLIIHFIGHPPFLSILNLITQMRFSLMHIKWLLKKIKPDLVHGIGTDHEYGFIATQLEYPSVITVHGVMKQVAKKHPNLGWSSPIKLFAKFEKKAINNTKNLISINKYVTNQFKEYSNTTFQIENPISQIFFSKPMWETYHIAFVSMFDERKRLLTLISACKILKNKFSNLKVHIYGSSKSTAYKKKADALIFKYGLCSNIIFKGQYTQADLAEEMSQMSVLALTSIEETAPMVISEAMALGKPIVATDVGGIKYMIKDGITGYIIPPDNIKILAEKLSMVLSNHSLRFSMGKNAKKIAQSLYHPTIVAKKTTNAYLKILSSRH